MKENLATNHLLEKFSKAILPTFKCLAIDLDGTLLDEHGNLHEESFLILQYLLRSFVPVIIVTGRGFGSSKRQIESRIPAHLKKHLFVANYNGAVIRSFNEKELVIYEAQLPNSEELFSAITSIESPFYERIILSNDNFISKYRPYGLTIVIKDDCEIEQSEIVDYLSRVGFDVSKLLILFSGRTIDILSAQSGKQNAIEIIAAMVSLDVSEIARVGDQGQNGGNDSDMLECTSGFTVGRFESQNRVGCHRVVNEEGKILVGTEATYYLLKHLHWDPKCVIDGVFFEDVNLRKKHQLEYDLLAQEARDRLDGELEIFQNEIFAGNEILSEEALSVLKRNGLNSSFSFNGAVVLSQDEIDKIPDFLQDFSSSSSEEYPGQRKYCLQYGSQIYFRAEVFYTTLKDFDFPDEAVAQLCRELLDLLAFLPIFQDLIFNNDLSLEKWKISLAFYDHLQIILLHLFHIFSYLQKFHEVGEALFFEEIRALLFSITEIQQSLISLKKPVKNININQEKIKRVGLILIRALQENKLPERVLSKAVRGISETDHPLFNAIYARVLATKIKKDEIDLNNLVIIGLHYGGAGLPFTLNYHLKQLFGSLFINPTYASVHYSRYSNNLVGSHSASAIDLLDKKEISLVGKSVLIVDDGVFSGATLQKIGGLFISEGAEVTFSVMSIANNRRIGQIMDESGVDSSFVRNELSETLIRVSPFMRVYFPEEYHAQRADHRLNLVKTRARNMLVGSYPQKKADPFSKLREEVIVRHPISRKNIDLSHLKP